MFKDFQIHLTHDEYELSMTISAMRPETPEEKLTRTGKHPLQLEAKKKELDEAIAKSNANLNQIAAETEKNRIDAVANKAKEKANNEKEIALKEREKNVKILETTI